MPFVIDKTLDINAPAEVVWEVISDLARYPEWNPFCLECRSTLQPGDPIDMTVKLMAKPQQQREWMISCEPGTGFSYRMKPVPLGALSSQRSHTIVATGAATARYRSYFHLQGWMKVVVLGLFRGKLEQGFAGMTDAIKARAESLWAQRQASAAA